MATEIITLPDGKQITSVFSHERAPIDDTIIAVLAKGYAKRYNKKVLRKKSMYWTTSVGNKAFDEFKELYNAKGITSIPLVDNNHVERGNVYFENLYVLIDNFNDSTVPKLLRGIAIFTICTRLLATGNDEKGLFLNSIKAQVEACIRRDGSWDIEQLGDTWRILNHYFTNVLGCSIQTID